MPSLCASITNVSSHIPSQFKPRVCPRGSETQPWQMICCFLPSLFDDLRTSVLSLYAACLPPSHVWQGWPLTHGLYLFKRTLPSFNRMLPVVSRALNSHFAVSSVQFQFTLIIIIINITSRLQHLIHLMGLCPRETVVLTDPCFYFIFVFPTLDSFTWGLTCFLISPVKKKWNAFLRQWPVSMCISQAVKLKIPPRNPADRTSSTYIVFS